MADIKMRSRQFNDLTNWEIEEYLKRSDIIIVPVGHCECLGVSPVDGEYVGAHAWANLIAEEVDALVLPGVTFTSPGGTQTGRGTIHMSMADSFNHVLSLMHSLLNQGFRRQVFIPGHGPTKAFLNAVTTQFFDETKVPTLYLDVNLFLTRCGILEAHDITSTKPRKPATTKDGTILERYDRTLGSYKIVNRLDIFPAKGEVDFPPAEEKTFEQNFAPWYLDECRRLFWCSDISGVPIYFQHVDQHGSAPVATLTREEMEIRAEIGERYMRELVQAADFPELMFALRKLDNYMKDVVKEHGNHLPPNRYYPNNK